VPSGPHFRKDGNIPSLRQKLPNLLHRLYVLLILFAILVLLQHQKIIMDFSQLDQKDQRELAEFAEQEKQRQGLTSGNEALLMK